jgi:hypothetical protein
MKHRQIGELMNVPLPASSEQQGGHVTVREMVKRGRRVLREAFGSEGWRKRVEDMKADQARWDSLTHAERILEVAALGAARNLNVSVEEARRWLRSLGPSEKPLAASFSIRDKYVIEALDKIGYFRY